MSNPLLEPFREAYRNLELLPLLTDTALQRFGVEYGTEVIEELEQLIEDSPSGDGKILLAGHRGCGKSTLLYKLKRKLDDRYFVVFFSIADTIEMSDVNPVNILFSIAIQLIQEAGSRQLTIKEFQKKNFHPEIELKHEGKISDLVEQINEIAIEIRVQTNREILVIVDDLDKIDRLRVRDIFQAKAISSLSFPIILTISLPDRLEVSRKNILPMAMKNRIVVLPVPRPFKQLENPIENSILDPEVFERLKSIILKRVDPELIAPDTLRKICFYSGGVLRELIRITNNCCRTCLRSIRRDPDNQTVKINDTILEEVITKLSIDFDRSIGLKDYEIIKTVYEKSKPNDIEDIEFLNLLHGLYILEYQNFGYGVHPIVINLMRRKGAIDTLPKKRRTPPISLVGKVKILGDIVSPIVEEEDWECLKQSS